MTNIFNSDGTNAAVQDSRTFENAADILLLMSEPVRLTVLSLLLERELSIGQLVKAMGDAEPDLFHHLAVLKKAGLVTMRRGKETYYSCRNGKVSCILEILEEEFGYCRDVVQRH